MIESEDDRPATLEITHEMMRRGVEEYFLFNAETEEPENLVATIFAIARSEWEKKCKVSNKR